MKTIKAYLIAQFFKLLSFTARFLTLFSLSCLFLCCLSRAWQITENEVSSRVNRFYWHTFKTLAAYNGYIESKYAQDFNIYDYVFSASVRRNISPAIVFALIQQESAWNPNAKSATSDFGLMQINKSNFRFCGFKTPEDALDPIDNVECGLSLFERALQKTNFNPITSLKIYNTGRDCGSSCPSKTNAYVPAILSSAAQETFERVSLRVSARS